MRDLLLRFSKKGIFMSTELLDALLVLESEKGISKDIIIDAIEAALISAYKRNFNQAQKRSCELLTQKWEQFKF